MADEKLGNLEAEKKLMDDFIDGKISLAELRNSKNELVYYSDICRYERSRLQTDIMLNRHPDYNPDKENLPDAAKTYDWKENYDRDFERSHEWSREERAAAWKAADELCVEKCSKCSLGNVRMGWDGFNKLTGCAISEIDISKE